MNVRPVDPRDQTSEVDTPDYRVYFWSRAPPPPGMAEELMMFRSDEFELNGATDVQEALAWAEENADGRAFTLYAAFGLPGNKTLVRLAGVDPTRGDVSPGPP